MSKNFPTLSDKAKTEIAETVVKSKNPNKRTSTTIGEIQTNPGDNSRYLRNALTLYDLPPINIANPEEVKERIAWYFNHCADKDTKPAVNGLAMAIGVTRQVLWNWAKGVNRVETHKDIIERAFQVMEVLWEEYMQNGKINPVAGIFLGKNHFSYQDKTEFVLTPNNPLGGAEDPEAVRQRYLADSSDNIHYDKMEEED